MLAHSFGGKDGVNLQHIYEGGESFERLIDHPAWIEKVKHFVGGQTNFDAHHGPLFIDENFANIRGPGEAIGLHSGGHKSTKRCQFRYRNGEFSCGQINILMGLNDIGPGDGATMVIPGSHKANFNHPDFERHKIVGGAATSVDDVEGAVEVHLNAGDALLFVDAISHGSAARINPDERRIAVFRYGPSWGNFRHPYAPRAGVPCPADTRAAQDRAAADTDPARAEPAPIISQGPSVDSTLGPARKRSPGLLRRQRFQPRQAFRRNGRPSTRAGNGRRSACRLPATRRRTHPLDAACRWGCRWSARP